MDSRASESAKPAPLRRSTRISSVFHEPTPRSPIKGTKRRLEPPAAAVNGSRDVESDSEDEGSPSKKRHLETEEEEEEEGGRGDVNEMDVQESVEELERNDDQEMDIGQDSSHDSHHPKICQGAQGEVNFSPRVVLGERYQPRHAVNEAKRENTSTKGPQKDDKSATQIRSAAKRHDAPIPKTSMEEYWKKIEGKPAVNNHVSSMYPAIEKSYTTRQRVNHLPTQKEAFQHKKQEKKKPPVTKTRPAHSSRGFLWYLCCLFLLILLSSSAVLLAYMIIPVLRRTAGSGEHPSRALMPEKFADRLTLLETQFPSQRTDVWKRSKIHLEKHLKTAQPTEPVSLIFTAGHGAERTLLCLAQGLASAFSSALNASVLHIDGASKDKQDSDGVKLEIDSQFRAAFEGDKPVALVHRLEELPPGSTLIFYRYCDHENAAYKRVFLLFTVLLPQVEVKAEQSLKEVEEMVHDYVKEKLVGDGNQAAFNDMDVDKYGGLWSRISHLILPVVSEKDVEEKGC